MVIAAALLLGSPASAPASFQVGWSCAANDTEDGWTLLASGNSFPRPSPFVEPEGGPKVITGWQVTLGPGLGPIRQRLEVFAAQGEGNEFKKVGETGFETLVEGVNSFPARIPTAGFGGTPGLYGPEGTVYCTEEVASSLLFEGSVTAGEAMPFTTVLHVTTPVAATYERDEDADGYGDETQDRCSLQSWTHGPCESFGILTPDRRVTRRAIWVQLEATMAGIATVTGTISLPLRKGIRAVKLRPVDVALSQRAIVTARGGDPERGEALSGQAAPGEAGPGRAVGQRGQRARKRSARPEAVRNQGL